MVSHAAADRSRAIERDVRLRASRPSEAASASSSALPWSLWLRWRGSCTSSWAMHSFEGSTFDPRAMSHNQRLRHHRMTFCAEDIDRSERLLSELLRLSGVKCALLVDKDGHLVTK